MKKKDKDLFETRFSLLLPSSSDLRARQSVRATFKLSEKAISLMSIVSTHLGIKQKSLFDHLIDDVRSLNHIAGEIRPEVFDSLARVQKTYVISRKTLSCLGEISKRYDAPRDALVEYSIQRLLPIINEEKEKHRKRKAIFAEYAEHIRQGEKLLKKSREMLGEDDPVYAKLENSMSVSSNAYRHIKSFIERGEMIEEF